MIPGPFWFRMFLRRLVTSVHMKDTFYDQTILVNLLSLPTHTLRV